MHACMGERKGAGRDRVIFVLICSFCCVCLVLFVLCCFVLWSVGCDLNGFSLGGCTKMRAEAQREGNLHAWGRGGRERKDEGNLHAWGDGKEKEKILVYSVIR